MKISDLDTITFSDIEPDSERKTTEDVSQYLRNFEDCLENYDTDFPFSLLHYAILFRRFSAVYDMLVSMQEHLYELLHIEGPDGYESITPLVCLKWNMFYIYAYDDKHGTNIIEMIEPYLDEVENVDEKLEYDEKIDEKVELSVFSLVWDCVQPMLDVIYYEKQELASKQLKNNSGSVVIDEVGTGKTVTALYAMRDVIEENSGDDYFAAILVVCPYNKREDWQNDIRRQLGRYAHIVEQGDDGRMYEDDMKRAFFHSDEHLIMISGQKQSQFSKNGTSSALKGSLETYNKDYPWDLVIIDEAHMSFDNYKSIIANKIMLLTATPVVVNSKGKRDFRNYSDLLGLITRKKFYNYEINPVYNYLPSENDIFVNWFREDFGRYAAERSIKFVGCERHEKRDEVYRFIKNEKGTLTALAYDQDDWYLFKKAKDNGYDDIPENVLNDKIDKLISLLQKNSKSYIVFCEHQYVVECIFNELKNVFCNDIVALKYGKNENQIGLGNVPDGQLINTLMHALREDRRVILITTGKSGGTGLNLGEFDGVIHYELPFTSIELEQRFGRVDRIDSQNNSREKEMIFLLNKCGDDDNDLIVNRMLYYCTTKIDITCQYMPVRNTVLYYPEFIKRNGLVIRDALVKLQNNAELSEENEEFIKSLKRQRTEKEKSITANELWNNFSGSDNNRAVYAKCKTAVGDEKISGVPDVFYKELSEYVEYVDKIKKEINQFKSEYHKYLDTRKIVLNWLAIIGLIETEEESDIFVRNDSVEDLGADTPDTEETDDEEKINSNLIDNSETEEDDEINHGTIQGKIKDLINKVDEVDLDHLELQGFSSEGVFVYADKTIKRCLVSEYRKGAFTEKQVDYDK